MLSATILLSQMQASRRREKVSRRTTTRDPPSWFKDDYVGEWGDLCGGEGGDAYCSRKKEVYGRRGTGSEVALSMIPPLFSPYMKGPESASSLERRMARLKMDFFRIRSREFVFVSHGNVMKHLSESHDMKGRGGFQNNAIVKLVFRRRRKDEVPILVSRRLEYEGNVPFRTAILEEDRRDFDAERRHRPSSSHEEERTVYLIRHGQSCSNNILGEVGSQLRQGTLDMTVFQDPYLTGRAQQLGRGLLSHLDELDPPLAAKLRRLSERGAVYASPMRRTRQTADLVFGRKVEDDHILGWGFEKRNWLSDVMTDPFLYHREGSCRRRERS